MSSGSISMTSARVRPQSAAGGHRTNMWLKCLAVSMLIAVAASSEVFTNSFLVRFKRGVPHAEAHQVAQRHGFDNLGPVSGHVMHVNIADAIRGITKYFWRIAFCSVYFYFPAGANWILRIIWYVGQSGQTSCCSSVIIWSRK